MILPATTLTAKTSRPPVQMTGLPMMALIT